MYIFEKDYRYILSRDLDPLGLSNKGTLLLIMLNPSTADETTDDPTIRRCIGFANSWGYRYLEVMNLYAYRATDPKDLASAGWPVGKKNDIALRAGLPEADLIVCAWGGKARRDRVNYFYSLAREAGVSNRLHSIGRCNADGSPPHPLYLKKDLRPVKYCPV